jgi:hypothetical protein
VKKEPAGWRLCIDAIGQTFEMYMALLEFIHQINQSFHAASETIEFPNNQYQAAYDDRNRDTW